jgi:SAM-dependent methyltransferase
VTNPFRDHASFLGTYAQYLDLIESNYFTICKDQHVLEIGALNGHHSELICKNHPSKFEVIEPNKSLASTELQQINGIDNIIIDDALLALSNPHPCDVVVCFGVLYHLHSPIHLLELIVNHCQPKFIMLDSVGKFNENGSYQNYWADENVNQLGTRQVRPGFRFSGLTVMCNGDTFQLVMNRLGYSLLTSNDLCLTDFPSKHNSWIAMWQRKGTQ